MVLAKKLCGGFLTEAKIFSPVVGKRINVLMLLSPTLFPSFLKVSPRSYPPAMRVWTLEPKISSAAQVASGMVAKESL